MISKQFFHTLQAKVREAELETDAELVTVLAPASDGYRYIPTLWAALLAGIPVAIALGLDGDLPKQAVLVGGLLIFGAVFAINSSLHSYLIVSYAKEDGVSLDVGFYYMSNALGRLVGTLLSGWVFQEYGLQACLWVSSAFVVLAALISIGLPRHQQLVS